MIEPAQLDYLILSCDKFWQCGELRRKRSRAVTQWIFLRLARVKFKRIVSLPPLVSSALLGTLAAPMYFLSRAWIASFVRLCIFLCRGCCDVYQNIKSAIKPAHAGACGKRTDKINGGEFRSFAKPRYVARAGFGIAVAKRAIRKSIPLYVAEIQVVNRYFSARFAKACRGASQQDRRRI